MKVLTSAMMGYGEDGDTREGGRMSQDLTEQFQKAAQEIKTLSKAPSNDVMLRLYALFKQASHGDCTGDRPGLMDFVGRAKHDAWKAVEGTSRDEAMQRYIALVQEEVAAQSEGN